MIIGTDFTRNLNMFKLPESCVSDLSEHDELMFIDYDSIDYESLKRVEVFFGDRLTTDIVRHMDNLKWIHLASSGYEKLSGINKDIIVTNSRGVFDYPVVSTVLAFIFALSRGLHHCVRSDMNRHSFDKYFNEINDVFSQSCLIVGMGSIGNKLASVCENLNMDVVGIKTSGDGNRIFSLKDLQSVVPRADFIINLLPLNVDTKDVFDMNIFNKMKKSAFFINVGRGGTVVEKDLLLALKNNQIAGAGLDVFQNEPLKKDSKLWKLDNVIITPHVAGVSRCHWKRSYGLFSENLKLYRTGSFLNNEVNVS